MLGGNHVQLTAIRAALKDGYYVITADYLPENPGHKLANACHDLLLPATRTAARLQCIMI